MRYTIPSYKRKQILNKIEGLNKRIVGMEGQRIEYTASLDYEKTININDADMLVKVFDIDVTNPMVSLNGWSFLAITEHSKKGNIILKKLYDVEIPEQYQNSDTYCEHCNTNRYRKYTYLVYNNDTKEIHQVGSTCLTAYLGFDASLLMAHAELFTHLKTIMDDDRERGRMVKRGVETQTVENFLKLAIVTIEKYGYVSAKKAREYYANGNELHEDSIYHNATGYTVWGINYNKKYWKNELEEAKTDRVNEIYTKIIEWVKGLETKSDYIRNIQILVDRDYVTYKTATTAASIVGVYNMNLQKNKVEDKKVSNWFGTIKERIDVDLILKRKTPFESKFGISNCYMFETQEGNVAILFTAAVELEEGKRYVGKATVTKHTEYKGLKQTVINRVKLNEVE
jgi:hypothetical protein